MCPICLSAIEQADRAVLQWCMHRFCAHCIEKWSRVRRLCPLCKVEYHGWYYGVQSNSKFQERILPLAPAENHALSTSHPLRDSRRQFGGRGRMPPRHQRVAPNTAASTSQRSVPFPTQRSFGLPRQPQGPQAMRVLEEQAAVRALQWRQSIYSRNLLARPFDTKKKFVGH
jgi:E3 ubiquitin-protein ligase Topors